MPLKILLQKVPWKISTKYQQMSEELKKKEKKSNKKYLMFFWCVKFSK